MTVIQKCSRAEMAVLIEKRIVENLGDSQNYKTITADLIMLESVGLISFPPEVKYDEVIEYDAPAIYAAAMHITSGTSLGTKWSIDDNVALAMLLDLVKAGFRISRDKVASEDELTAALTDSMLAVGVKDLRVIDPSHGDGHLVRDSALVLIRHLRDTGFEIVKTDRGHDLNPVGHEQSK